MSQKILFVDDDPLMHRLYEPHLERAGYRVLSANTGLEALKLATSQSPDVIILDIIMPEMDGLSVLFQLKRFAGTMAVPVIMMSAETSYWSCSAQLTKSGAAAFVTKPFGPASILNIIRRVRMPD